MEVVTTRDLGNRIRVRFAGMFDAIQGMPAVNPVAAEVIAFLDVTPCLRCTGKRYCSVACQDFTEQSEGFFEVERQVERGQAAWGRLGEHHQRLCDAALACWRTLAAKVNHARACYCLGFCYELGRGVACSFPEAQKWLKKASALKLREAQSRLGLMLRDGRGSKPNDNGAIRAFRGAAKQGDAEAFYNVGKLRQAGRGGCEPNAGVALALIEQSTHRDRTHARAQTALGLARMKQAAAQHRAPGAGAETTLAGGGGGGDRDRGDDYDGGGARAATEAEAARLWRAAAESGYPRAQYNLALLLEKGRGGLDVDPDGAIGWWRRAADQGHAGALYCLALRFMQRHAREQAQGAAAKAEAKAAARAMGSQGGDVAPSGGEKSPRKSDGLSSTCPGMPASAREAVRLWRRAAEQRHGGALLMLGLCVERGWGGCVRDPAKALELVHQSLDEGHLPAKRHLDRLRGGDPGHKPVARSTDASLASALSTLAPGSEAGRFSASTSPFWLAGAAPVDGAHADHGAGDGDF